MDVCPRNVYHSQQRCVEQLCRVRGPKEIYDICTNNASIDTGPNEAASYIIHLCNFHVHALGRWPHKSYCELYEEINGEQVRYVGNSVRLCEKECV